MSQKLTAVVFTLFLAVASSQGQQTKDKPTKNVAVFVFPKVQIIDFAGPYEVFANASAANHSYFNVFTVAATDEEIETSGGLTIKPKYRLDNHPKVDILVLPGGYGVSKSRQDPEVIKWIQKTAGDAEIVFSICNGARFLAKAGLLDGKEATTTAGAIDGLQREVPTAKIVAGKRFVDSGKIVTAGGLSAGIDGALYVVQKALGKGWGQMIAVWMEYDWHPDAQCAWGLLAERWLPNPIVDFQGFKGVWTPISFGGGTDHWENNARFETKLSAEELMTAITGNVTKYLKWSPRPKGSEDKSGKTLWAFRDKLDRDWHGVVSVEPAGDKLGMLDVAIRIEHQGEKARPDDAAIDKKALQALDNFMNAFNASDRKKQAATFHFPHVRIAGDKVTVFQTAEEFEKNGDLDQLLKEAGWHHSAWDSRTVIQRSDKKVNMTVRFTRYDKEGGKIGTYESLYVLTNKDGRWGIQARSSFAP